MKKSRFTQEQIAFALRQAEAGTPIVEVCRKMGVPPGKPSLGREWWRVLEDQTGGRRRSSVAGAAAAVASQRARPSS